MGIIIKITEKFVSINGKTSLLFLVFDRFDRECCFFCVTMQGNQLRLITYLLEIFVDM